MTLVLIWVEYYLNRQSCSKTKWSSTNGLVLLLYGAGRNERKPIHLIMNLLLFSCTTAQSGWKALFHLLNCPLSYGGKRAACSSLQQYVAWIIYPKNNSGSTFWQNSQCWVLLLMESHNTWYFSPALLLNLVIKQNNTTTTWTDQATLWPAGP